MSTTEISTSKVILDNSQAENALKELRTQAKLVRKELEEMKLRNDPGLVKKKKEFADLNRQIDETRRSTFNLEKVLQTMNGSSLKDLTRAQRQLTAEIRNSSRATSEEVTELNRKKQKLREIGDEINKVKKDMAPDKGGGFMGRFADSLNKYQTLLMGAVAASAGIFVGIQNMLQGNAELSDAMADVAKTSGLAAREVKELYKGLGKIDTRTSRRELLDLAYVAGKLGYSGKNEILGFVKAADQIGVALSRDLGENVEGAVTSLGKLLDVFKVKSNFSVEESLLKTGSAINALGAAGTANEAYIVEFTQRMGGIAPQAGLTIQQVMGLGATLDQLGQQSETSGTALTNLLTKMFSKPGEFAAIAGVDVKKFTDLLKTDANAALIMFLEGMQKNKGGLQELAANFGDLGIDGQRAITVVGALSNNLDMLKQSQELSNREFAKGTSLTNEFNLKNENMAGNLEKIGKALRSAFVNSALMNGLSSIVSTMASWFKIPMAKKLEEERTQTNLLANRLLEANISAATRNKLYAELKGLSPEVVKGIDKEAIAYDKLRKNLEDYNNQMIRKIAVAKADELVTEAAGPAAQYLIQKTELEDKIRSMMIANVEGVKKFNASVGSDLDKIVNNSFLNFEQKYRLFRRTVQNNRDKNLGIVQTTGTRFDYLFNEYTRYSELERKATEEVNKATEKRESLAKGLASAIGEVTEQVIENTNANKENFTPDGPGPDVKIKDTKEELYKKQQDILRQSIESDIALMEEGYQKELFSLHEKYRQQREVTLHELEGNSSLTVQQREDLNNLLSDQDQKYVMDVEDLNRSFASRTLQFNQKLISLKLETVRKGSLEENQLKKELLQSQMDFELAELKGTEEQKAVMAEAIRRKYSLLAEQEDQKYSRILLDDKLKQDLIALNESENQKLEALRLSRQKGEISRKQYNRELLRLQKEFTAESLRIAIEKAEREMAILRAAGEDTVQAEQALSDLRLRLQQNATGKETDSGTGPSSAASDWNSFSGQDWGGLAIDSAQQTADTVFQINASNHQRELDSKLASLDRMREAELSNKRLTEKQKADINARYDAKSRALKKAAWEKQHKADLAMAWINLALGVGKAAINTWPVPAIPMMAAAAVSGGLQVAAVASQKVPEFAKGRYNVTGAQTGRQYQADFTGPAVTGLYTRPSLVAENGSEMIIDGATTRNIMMNFPGIMDAIQAARVPQYASGRYFDKPEAAFSPSKKYMDSMDRFVRVMDKISESGIQSTLSLFELETMEARKKRILSATEI